MMAVGITLLTILSYLILLQQSGEQSAVFCALVYQNIMITTRAMEGI